MKRYDFHDIIARAMALHEQSTCAGLDPLTTAALVIADRIQLALEVSVQTLARLALSGEHRPVFGGMES